VTTTSNIRGVSSPRPKRRSPGEARKVILSTARRLFSDQGYANTSTRQIAAEAGAAEPLIFRHFGTKASLFDEAMLEPYREFMAEFTERWREELKSRDEIGAVTARFVRGLCELMRTHRKLFVALVASRAFDDVVAGLENGFGESDLSRQLDRFDRFLRDSHAPVPRKLDSAVSFRLIVGSVMAATVLDEWLFPGGANRPTDERIEHELVQYALYGVLGRRPDEV
jgi:AcrR family transcriptional regulator